jgi:hypothetical protein
VTGAQNITHQSNFSQKTFLHLKKRLYKKISQRKLAVADFYFFSQGKK